MFDPKEFLEDVKRVVEKYEKGEKPKVTPAVGQIWLNTTGEPRLLLVCGLASFKGLMYYEDIWSVNIIHKYTFAANSLKEYVENGGQL